MATHDDSSIFSKAWDGISTAWDVATGSAPATQATSIGDDPAGSGAYAQASQHTVAGQSGAVGGSFKAATGGGARGKEDAPWWMPSDWASAEGGAGRFRDAGGDEAYGLWAEGQAGKTSGELYGSAPKPAPDRAAKPADYVGYEYGGPDGAIGAKVTAKSAAVSAQASGFNLGLSQGTRGTDHDEETRFGLAPVGPGGGGRLHYGDADKDGHREYGFGLDVGPVSFDMKTEDPLYKLLHPFEQRSAQIPHRNQTQDTIDGARLVAGGVSDLWKRFTE